MILLLLLAAFTDPPYYELQGKFYAPPDYKVEGPVRPFNGVLVRLEAANRPILLETYVLPGRTYHFKKLEAGPYVVRVRIPSYGLYEQTVEIGPSQADAQRRVTLDLRLDQDPAKPLPHDDAKVSVRRLTVPDAAQEQLDKAIEAFTDHQEEKGIQHLKKAIEIAPQFAEAWNTLGTVYFHRGEFVQAEERFREALRLDPKQFSPLANLGGALIAQKRWDEALPINEQAVRDARKDSEIALANTQLGWCFLRMKRMAEAAQCFERAKQASPNHFSRPQLGLAEVYFRQGDHAREAAELQDYLRRFPDDKQAPEVRRRLQALKDGKQD